MKRNSLQNSLGLVALLLSFTAGCSGQVSERTNSESQAYKVESRTEQTAETTEKAPGLVVHIDPKTGQIISPPAGAVPGQLPRPLDTTQKPPSELRETLSPVPGGGVVIDLDDRFMTPLTATVDAEGKVRIEHKRTRSGSDENQQ